MTKKFLVVRFAPGSAGKFCSTLLQLSPDVNVWESEFDQARQDPQQALDYFKKKFTRNFRDWQKNEPEIPYHTQFVSNRFPRGDDITHEQALNKLVNDRLFNDHYKNQQRIVLISNKSRVPDWLRDHAEFVNVYIDTIAVKKWVQRARYCKLFLETKPGTFILKQEHPDYCSAHRATLARQFQNTHTVHTTKFSFLKHYVLNDPITKMFTNYQQIVQDISNINVPQHALSLSNLLDPRYCYAELSLLCEQIGIQCPDQNLVESILNYYLSIHKTVDNPAG